jgi:hypothetical protein
VKEFRFESKSSPGTFYTTTVHDDGSIMCDERPGNECRGYKYSKKTPRSCTHVEAVQKSLDTGKPVSKTLTNIFQAPLKPMLASALPEDRTIDDYSAADYVMEEKFDGHRRIILVTADGVSAWSRLGNVVELPLHLKQAVRACCANGLYDAEQLIPGGTATDVKALDKQDEAILRIFDLLALGSSQSPTMALPNRRVLLEESVTALDATLAVAEQWDPSRARLKAFWADGKEGAVLKKRGALYVPGKRSRDWIKLKRFVPTTMTVIGFAGGKLGPHSVVLVVDDHGIETSVKALDDTFRASVAVQGPAAFVGRRLVVEHQGRTEFSYRSPMFEHFLDEEV